MTLTLTPPPRTDAEGTLFGCETRTARLAELVVHLTGCEPEGALDAVQRHDLPPASPDAALGVVAEAMLSVSRSAPRSPAAA